MYGKISFAAALLLGLTSATGYEKTGNLVNEPSYLTFDYTYGFDITYQTERSSGPYTGSDRPHDGFQYEWYQLAVESTAYLSVETTWFNHYMNTIEFEFMPFRFVPYQQYIIWTRPAAHEDNDFNLYAQRSLELLTFTTYVTENTKTFETSVYDYIDDSSAHDIYPHDADMMYNEDYENYYADPYWSYDLGAKILPASLYNHVAGTHAYYNYWAMGKYTW
jgi:hypothetical protein